MMKSLEKSGRTVDEALRAALGELGLDVDDVSYSYEIVTRPKSGFLGIGSVPAVVRVSYETKDEPVVEARRREEARSRRQARRAEGREEARSRSEGGEQARPQG